LMDLKTVVFATHVGPPPVPTADSYPTSPTSPAGVNPIAAGLLNAAATAAENKTAGKEPSLGEVVRVG
jgi:hypothetical protein